MDPNTHKAERCHQLMSSSIAVVVVYSKVRIWYADVYSAYNMFYVSTLWEFEFVLSQLHQALMKKAHTEHKLNQDTVLSDAMTVLPF